MKQIYICSTLKSEWNLNFNTKLCTEIEKRGYSIYLPQRDTNQSGPKHDILRQNMQAMKNCKLLLAVGKNTTPNWGAEVGYMWGSKKPVIIVSDSKDNVPLMTQGMTNDLFLVDSLEHVETYIEELVSKFKDLKI